MNKRSILAWLLPALIMLAFSIYQWVTEREQYPLYAGVVDRYDPRMDSIHSISALVSLWDRLAEREGITEQFRGRRHVDLLDSLVRSKFFHGWGEYDFSDNYVAAVLGRLVRPDIAVLVIPDDIMRVNKAMCSQQVIVFLEALRQRGYTSRMIKLRQHVCAEVFYEGSWRFYDPNGEPVFPKDKPLPDTETLLEVPEMADAAYRKNPWHYEDASGKNFVRDHIEFGETGEEPAENMKLFHRLTKAFSHFGWLVFLVPVIVAYQKKRHLYMTT